MSGIKLTVDVMRAGKSGRYKPRTCCFLCSRSRDESHHIAPFKNLRKHVHCRRQFQVFLIVRKGTISPGIAVREITAPYPRKYYEEGQAHVGSKNDQEVDRSILYNCHDNCRNPTRSAEGQTDDRNERHSICKVCTLACSPTSMSRTWRSYHIAGTSTRKRSRNVSSHRRRRYGMCLMGLTEVSRLHDT